MMNHKTGEEGHIVLLLIMLMSLLMLLGGYFLDHTLKEYLIASNHEKNVQTYYIAEAGIELAFGVLSKDFYFNPGGETLEGQLEEGHFQVSLGIIEGNKRLITSTGFTEGAEENISAWVIQEEGAKRIEVRWIRPLPDH